MNIAEIAKRAVTPISPTGAEVEPSGEITYVLRYANPGTTTLNNVVIVDGAPANTRLNAANFSNASGANAPAPTGGKIPSSCSSTALTNFT